MRIKRKFSCPFIVRLAFLLFVLIYFPLVIFQCFMMGHSERKFQIQNDDYYNVNTYYCATRFSDQLDYFRTQATIMRTEERLKRPLDPGCIGYSLFETAQLLNTYQTGYSMSTHVGIFYRGTDTVITNGNKYNLAGFLVESQHFSSTEYKILQNLFLNNNEQYWSYSNYSQDTSRDRERLIFAYPICMKNYQVYDAVVFYIMTPNSVNAFLGSGFPNKEFNFALLDGQKNVLFISNPELSEMFFPKRNEIKKVQTQIFDGEYSIYPFEINSGLEFDTIVRTGVVNGNLKKYSDESLVIILITDTLLFIFSMLFIFFSNRPVKKLIRGISKNTLFKPQNEFQYIEQAINQMDSELFEQKQQLVNYVVRDLIEGISLTPQKEQVAKKDFCFAGYCVVSVVCENIEYKIWEEICNELYESSFYTVCHFEERDANRTILICCSQYKTSANALQKTLDTIIVSHSAEPYLIELGNIVDSYTEIRNSYLSLRQLSAGANPNKYSDCGENYAKQEIILALKYIKSGQLREARNYIDVIFAKISVEGSNVERYVCYDLLISLMRALSTTKYAPNSEEISKMMSFQTPQELRNILLSMASRISEDVKNMDSKSMNKMVLNILKYVDENFTQSDICLASVADKFDTSIFSLSKIFKQYTGVGFKQYINNKRFSKAHDMLLATDLSITEVAKLIGYDNPAYFSTIFKAFYGLSPSDLRKNL